MKNVVDKANIVISCKQGTHFTDLNFADDAALLVETNEQLQDMTTDLEAGAAKVELQISHSKTKVMRTGTVQSHINIQIGNTAIEGVQQFPYLSSILSYEKRGTVVDVNCRVGKHQQCFKRCVPSGQHKRSPCRRKSGSSTLSSFRLQFMPARHGRLP